MEGENSSIEPSMEGEESSIEPSMAAIEKVSLCGSMEQECENREDSLSNSYKTEISSTSNSKVWYDLSKNVNELEDTTDVVSKSESQERLNILLAAVALILLSFAMTVTILCFQKFGFHKIKVIQYEHPISKKKQHGIPHVMLMTDGKMVPYAWNSAQKTNANYPNLWKKMRQDDIYHSLPDPIHFRYRQYFLGFFDQGKLHVVIPDGVQDMLVIEKNGTFRDLPKSSFPKKSESLLMDGQEINELNLVHLNNLAWVLGGYIQELQGERLVGRQTKLWSIRKQKWFEGPTMPPNFRIHYYTDKHKCWSLSILVDLHNRRWIDSRT